VRSVAGRAGGTFGVRACGRIGAAAVALSALVACTPLTGRVAEPGAFSYGAGLPGDEPIPIDPDVRIGVLDNGLTYYVRENHQPGGWASLRLAVDAGSALETADQSGVAHFVEHMLFNGTARFPENALVDTLRGFGSEFGPDINAWTTYDETVYALSVPTDQAGPLSTAVDVLVDWLSAATIDQAQVEAERGVILDEWRGSQLSLEGRTFDAIERLFLAGTAYEGRDPIGTDVAIQSMTAEPLRRFYDAWYRPDNAAVVIVGDIDAAETERMITERFGPVTARTDPPPARPDLSIAAADGPRVEVHADPDATQSWVELTLPMPVVSQDTPRARRTTLLDAIVFDLVATRLSDDIARGVGVLTDADVDSNDHVRGIDAPSVLASCEPANHAAAATVLLDEFERVHRFGFDDVEVDRVVSSWRALVDGERDSSTSTPDDVHADDYVEHFLTGTAIPSATLAWELDTATLDSVTPAALLARFEERWTASSPHILVVGPADASLPDPGALLVDAGALADRPVSPRAPSVAPPDELMPVPAAVEEISSRELIDEPSMFLHPTELTFPNGARVVLNETDIVDGRVSFEALSLGGRSAVDVADAADALLAVDVVEAAGLGRLDAVEVDHVLAEADVSLEPYLGAYEEGLYGEAASNDVETAFQLLHLLMAAPVIDEAAVDVVRSAYATADRDLEADQDLATYAELVHLHYGDDARGRGVVTGDDVAALDVEGVRRVWQRRFGDAGDWVFAVSGDVDVETLADLARRYIGTLPGASREEAVVAFTPTATGVVATQRNAGTGERAQMVVLYSEPSAGTELDPVLAGVVGTIVSDRLTQLIREELGESYSPFAGISIEHDPGPVVQTYVQVTGAPDRMDVIAGLVQDVVGAIRIGYIAQEEVDAAIEIVRREEELVSNEEILDATVRAAVHHDDLGAFVRRYELLDGVGLTEIVAFAERYLPADRYAQVTTLPR
jgi:zinc protease